MIVTPKILARLVAIVIVGVLLQLSFFSRVALFHTSPDVLPALVVSLGLLGGSMTGAVTGFSIGLLRRLPAGRGARRRPRWSCSAPATWPASSANASRSTAPLVPPLLCMGLTLFAELGFGAVQLMLGIDSPVSPLIVRDMLLKSRLRVLPRLADLPRRAARPAPGPGRGAAGAPPRSRRRWEPRGRDVPALRRTRPRR